jgi:hypothetical protein
MEPVNWGRTCPRSRTCLLSPTQRDQVLKTKRSELASDQLREGGRFASAPTKKQTHRPVTFRNSQEAKVVQERYDTYVGNAQAQIASLKAEHAEQLVRLELRLKQQYKQLVALRIQHRNQLRKQRPVGVRVFRKLQGGISKPTLIKLAKRVEEFLSSTFANQETRQAALLQHFLRHPRDYDLITEKVRYSQAAFEQPCNLHPDWLKSHQQAVVKAIEDAWTLDTCLAAQIHCKIGHAEKWQFLINLLSKTFNSREKQWVRREIWKGSGVHLPLLKSKNQVNKHRAALHAIISLIQNTDGTACWADLWKLIEEAVKLDRERGYLQSRWQLLRDKLWLHWGGDAAGWMRGMSHSIWGFKLLGNQRVVTHSPKDIRVALTFEGKDKYSTYKEYLEPFLGNMDTLASEGLKVENTLYEVDQTVGADYVLMSEILGHFGASGKKGCCFCEEDKENYGKTALGADGRRVPLKAKARTIEGMAAAAHRPLTTGPDVHCPYCGEAFLDMAAVQNSPKPSRKSPSSSKSTLG